MDICSAVAGRCCGFGGRNPFTAATPRAPWSFTVPVTLLTYADKLYLASYINPPTADTLFPYPEPPVRSPSKRSRLADVATPAPRPPHKQPYYFTVDDSLLYNAFHHDFGPLHIGHLYRFALEFHDILGAKENKDRPVVFWSRADPRSRLPKREPGTPSRMLTGGRSRKRLVHARVLHGLDPVVAAASCSRAHRAG